MWKQEAWRGVAWRDVAQFNLAPQVTSIAKTN